MCFSGVLKTGLFSIIDSPITYLRSKTTARNSPKQPRTNHEGVTDNTNTQMGVNHSNTNAGFACCSLERQPPDFHRWKTESGASPGCAGYLDTARADERRREAWSRHTTAGNPQACSEHRDNAKPSPCIEPPKMRVSPLAYGDRGIPPTHHHPWPRPWLPSNTRERNLLGIFLYMNRNLLGIFYSVFHIK
ncbi:uncharacterized protein BJ171DRAFT_487840 [Polychytrium aggregatum]|uniref:uncharacterized protein n=1 Tax=Polychytrium aggregatum TaxID=110093 RepID=UPI0022FE662C|nr:uncharacterized protein BJ171DRAFT_526246 [Polychytrium aggregatum]XP_052971001.1 uncharacterized protein BJ171DRAFT_487840 [Polychytrium aggregatum]KAI9193531.1 hypothetical protein BJ171DRAFT_526246 [Polychytrium aggregatum]KAI9208921.1 hypothetical protein BJ171DRAFT_487840 [Polychytrium aggregatum]